jgi:glutathione-independent formaldehyde dehydrogenase
MPSKSNRGVVYPRPGCGEVQNIDFPTIDHGVLIRVVTTNICGSDQDMVRGPNNRVCRHVLGHEILGEVIEKGRDVECLQIGDLLSVPFNVACGRCRTCREGDTGVCLRVNSDRAGDAWICQYGQMDRW